VNLVVVSALEGMNPLDELDTEGDFAVADGLPRHAAADGPARKRGVPYVGHEATIEESVRTSLDPSFTRTRQYACTIQFRRLNGATAGQTIQRCDRLSIAGFAS
jgi:hypothetical protein